MERLKDTFLQEDFRWTQGPRSIRCVPEQPLVIDLGDSAIERHYPGNRTEGYEPEAAERWAEAVVESLDQALPADNQCDVLLDYPGGVEQAETVRNASASKVAEAVLDYLEDRDDEFGSYKEEIQAVMNRQREREKKRKNAFES